MPLPPVSTSGQTQHKILSSFSAEVSGMRCEGLVGGWTAVHSCTGHLAWWAAGTHKYLYGIKTFTAEQTWARTKGRLQDNAGMWGGQNSQRNREQSILPIVSDCTNEISKSLLGFQIGL